MQRQPRETKTQRTDWWKIIGLALLIAGGTLFVENQLHTGWLYYVPFLVLAAFAIWNGVFKKQKRFLLLGVGLLSICLIMFSVFAVNIRNTYTLLGVSFLIVGVCWLVYVFLSKEINDQYDYWALLLSGIFAGIGAGFLWREGQFLDFVLWVSLGASVPMLVWGYIKRYFGLLIAGFIILSGGVGVAVAWGEPEIEVSSLTRTGIMLIAFALGWSGISVLSRRFVDQVAWWPLIPAGVLAMSGGGLLIGGGVGESGQYVGNTLSIALIILGVYVLLLRSGFHRK